MNKSFLDYAGLQKFKQNNDSSYATLDSPAFTNAPTAPTQDSSDNSTKLATTAFVKTVATQVDQIENSASDDDLPILLSSIETSASNRTTNTSFKNGFTYNPTTNVFALPIGGSMTIGGTEIWSSEARKVSVALAAANWSNRVQTVSVPNLSNNANGFISVAENATTAQKEAIEEGNIHITGQATNQITMTCYGNLPSIDLPVNLLLFVPSGGIDDMTGASANSNGTRGTVPAPSAGDESKYLRGDGTWAEAAGGSSVSSVDVTLNAANWNTTTKTQTITVTGITANNTGFFGVAVEANDAQRENARNAFLGVINQSANSVTFIYDGDKPTVDIPLTVTIFN